MLTGPVDEDSDVRAALDWFGMLSGDAAAFRHRLEKAQVSYCKSAAQPANYGQDLELGDLDHDKVASYLAQADALLHNRGAYDLVLGARIVPFIKQLGVGIKLLRQIPGAAERASRMLRQKTVDPESAIFELAAAVRYAQLGYSVQFIPEAPGGERRPDFAIDRGRFSAEVECKRLRKGEYEKGESRYQRQIFRALAQLIDDHRLSIHVDVVYTRELKDVPLDYLAKWAEASLSCRILLPEGFPWKDEFGEGRIKPANLNAVHRDTRDSSLLFGPKMARLLVGAPVSEGAYNMTAGAKRDPRDARFVELIDFGSVVTWQCIAAGSINARARYVQSKLADIDRQMKSSLIGIAHIAMDAERDTLAADLRRKRNLEAVSDFAFESRMAAMRLHYFVPRVTEIHSWLIDETVDFFNRSGISPKLPRKIFSRSRPLNNNLPAWHQSLPLPPPI
ncbi:hypothetical protein [Cupriavidus basilensis]|uniref:hypothetical protein n=1 Tax=Cupriavidus basilensis TaxID=68895 RepID=UPI00157A41E2|nr:hypothetical protein [Cupriavidus basilensis]NUA28674.1 hypothetical protein [Cupriavidus basilensis]